MTFDVYNKIQFKCTKISQPNCPRNQRYVSWQYESSVINGYVDGKTGWVLYSTLSSVTDTRVHHPVTPKNTVYSDASRFHISGGTYGQARIVRSRNSAN